MSPLIAEEIRLLVCSILWGMCLAAGYDVTHGTVCHLFRKRWWQDMVDLWYWTICAIMLFAMICEENYGTIRWYILAGASVGAGIYYGGIRPWIHRLLRPVWIFARKTRQFVENLLKNRRKSVTLKDKIESGAVGAGKGKGHGQIR